VAVASALLCSLCAFSEPLVLGETQIKALFIVRFLSFVTWPKGDKDDPRAPMWVGTDDEQMAQLIGEHTKDKLVRGRKVKVVRVETDNFDPKRLQVFYSSATSPAIIDTLVQRARGHQVLSIMSTAGAAQAGVIINFVRFDQKVRFEVNYDELEASRLRMSSQLLRLSLIVGKRR
jgi:hypothetical protein